MPLVVVVVALAVVVVAAFAVVVVGRRFGYPAETVVRAADADWTVTQLDIGYRPRIGHSKVTGTVRGTLRAVRDMSAAIKRGAPT